MQMGQINRRTGGRTPDRYITLSARRGERDSNFSFSFHSKLSPRFGQTTFVEDTVFCLPTHHKIVTWLPQTFDDLADAISTQRNAVQRLVGQTQVGDIRKLSTVKHQSYDDCLEVRRKKIWTVLCCILYDSCAQWYTHSQTSKQFINLRVGLGFDFVFLCLFRFNIIRVSCVN